MPFVGALRRLLARRDLGHAAADHDIDGAAAGTHQQRAACRYRQRGCAIGRSRIPGGGQNDRRLAGIDRRGHPGVDPDIGRRQHAVPVERRGNSQRALVAGGDIGGRQHHHDQRAQRPGIVDRKPRRRQPGADPPDRGQRALALLPPQRLRDRVLGLRAYRSARSPGGGECRCRGRAGSTPLRGSASETARAGTTPPAPAGRTGRCRSRAQGMAAPATIRPRTPPETARRRSKSGRTPARRAPMQSHTGPVAGPASAEAARQHPARAGTSWGRGKRRSTISPGLPTNQPSTAAAMRHLFPGVTHTRKYA